MTESLNEAKKPKMAKGVKTKIDPSLFKNLELSDYAKDNTSYGGTPPEKWTVDDFVSFIKDNFDFRNRINPIRDRSKSDSTQVELLDAIFPLGYTAGELTGVNNDTYSKHVLKTNPDMFGVTTPLYDLYIGIWNDTFNAKIPADKFNR